MTDTSASAPAGGGSHRHDGRGGSPAVRPRIVHFSDTYLPRRDGVITSLRTLTTALTGAGYTNLTVVPRHRDQPADHPTDNDVLRLRSVPCGVADLRVTPWPRNRYVDHIAGWRPDLVHVHTPGPVGLLGVLTARRLNVPLVHTYHTDLHAYADAYRVPPKALAATIRLYARWLKGPRPEFGDGTTRAQRRHAVLNAGNWLMLGDANAVVVPTPAVLARAGLPVPTDRMYVVPTGVAPLDAPPGAGPAFRAQYGVAPDEPLVLFVGRVNQEKNIDLLAEAFSQVLRRLPHARLLLMGAVYEQRWLRRLLRRTGTADRTVVAGEHGPGTVAAAYAAADVFAFPSRTDTQGLVLQEASLAEVPTVMVDPVLHSAGPLAAAARLTDATPTGFAAGIAFLLTDQPTARALAAAAREHALRHTPHQYAGAMADVYARAAASHPTAPTSALVPAPVTGGQHVAAPLADE